MSLVIGLLEGFAGGIVGYVILEAIYTKLYGPREISYEKRSEIRLFKIMNLIPKMNAKHLNELNDYLTEYLK